MSKTPHTPESVSLASLAPRWVGAGISRVDGSKIPHRIGVGIGFQCPCGCGERRYADFDNPLDGGSSVGCGPFWHRQGRTFDRLTLSPSLDAPITEGGCGWHGWIIGGKVAPA